MDSFFEEYTLHSLDHTRPYPGVTEALQALKERGYKLAVVTNKPHAHAVHMISELFPPHGELFCQVQGQNSKFTLKPHPAPLQFVLDMQKVKNANALYGIRRWISSSPATAASTSAASAGDSRAVPSWRSWAVSSSSTSLRSCLG